MILRPIKATIRKQDLTDNNKKFMALDMPQDMPEQTPQQAEVTMTAEELELLRRDMQPGAEPYRVEVREDNQYRVFRTKDEYDAYLEGKRENSR